MLATLTGDIFKKSRMLNDAFGVLVLHMSTLVIHLLCASHRCGHVGMSVPEVVEMGPQGER